MENLQAVVRSPVPRLTTVFHAAAIALLGMPASAQQFAELGKLHLPTVEVAVVAMAVADVDGDTDQDLLLCDVGRVRVWLNDGAGRFTAAPTTVLVGGNAIASGDVDGDGDPDLVIGTDGESDELFLNDGSGAFTRTTNPFPGSGTLTRAVALGDVDRDGDLDVVLGNGEPGMGQPEQLFVNDGTGHFVLVTAQLPSAIDDSWSVALGDVDGDGDLDLVVGNDWISGGAQNALYLNDGGGSFTNASSRMPPVADRTRGTVLGDVDGDGDLDLVCADVSQNRLYLNDGSGTFHDATASLPVARAATIALGDVDGDGDLDLLSAGRYSGLYAIGGPVQLQLNDGWGTFVDASATHLPGTETAAHGLVLGDLDGDGDLDAAIGMREARRAHLYVNDGVGAFVDGMARHLVSDEETYAAATDDVDGDGDLDVVTPTRVYVNDGRGWLADRPLADPLGGSGQPFAIALGDVDGDGDRDVLVGTTLRNALYLNDGAGNFADVSAARLPALSDSTHAVVFADVDGDGDLDLVCANFGQDRLLINDGSGTFADQTGARLPVDAEIDNSVVRGDVDGDGDVDLAFGSWQRRLYLNDGHGFFTDVSATHLPGDVGNTRLVMGDVDGDGDLDIVCANQDPFPQNRLYQNDGTGSFTDVTATHLPVLADSTNQILLADFDSDGDLDLYCANGHSYSQPEPNRLCLNDGHGHFVEATNRLPALASGTLLAAAGDLDGDGDVDIFSDDDQPQPNRLWLNLLRQIDAPHLLRTGQGWPLDVTAQPVVAAGSLFALPFFGTVAAKIYFHPLGILGICPSQMVALPVLTIPLPGGTARLVIQVPNDAALIGKSIYTQALLIDWPWTIYLSNVTADVVLG